MAANILAAELFSYEDATSNLKLVGKRYTSGTGREPSDGVSLLLVHATGTHKEQFEPMLTSLFASQKSTGYRLREAIAFDSLTSGDTAALNQDALNSGKGETLVEYAQVLANFVGSDATKGRRFVVVGHSGGATTAMLTVKFCPSHLQSFHSVILIDPPFVDRETFRGNKGEAAAIKKLIASRRNSWKSKEEAYTWLAKKFPWKGWDDRVLRLYAEHGLCQRETGDVGLKCDPKYEAAGFLEFEATHVATEMLLDPSLASIPTTLLYAEVADVVPRYTSDAVSKSVENLEYVSVVTIPGMRHMVVQEAPDKIAVVLGEVLSKETSPTSKL